MEQTPINNFYSAFLQLNAIILLTIKSTILQTFKTKVTGLPLKLCSSTYQPSIQTIRFDITTTPKILIKYIILKIGVFFFSANPTAVKLQIDIARQIYSATPKYLTIFKSPTFRNCPILSLKSLSFSLCLSNSLY